MTPPLPVVYRTPITERDYDRIRSGHCRLYVTVRRCRKAQAGKPYTGKPAQLNFVLVPFGHEMWPHDWATHSIPLYLEPPPD